MNFESFLVKLYHNETNPGTKEDLNYYVPAYDRFNRGINSVSTHTSVCFPLSIPCTPR